MIINKKEFSLVRLSLLLSFLILWALFSGDLLNEPMMSRGGHNKLAATAFSFIACSLYAAYLIVYFGYHSAAFFYLIFQCLFYLPILFLVDFSDSLQFHFFVLHLVFFLNQNLALIMFFSKRRRTLPAPYERKVDPALTHIINISILVVSLFVTFLYYRANGGVIYQKTGGALALADARLSYYATGSYTYAGYANQFKNVLLPMTLILMLTTCSKRLSIIFLFPTILIIFVATTGTGQRAPFLVAGAGILIFFSFYYRFQFSSKSILILTLPVISFGFLSYLQGRIDDFSVLNSFIELFQRQFLVNQTANLETYWYVVERGFRFGQDWIQDLFSLAPSIKPNELPRELFGILWGSTERGNSPPSMVTSLYFNFSVFGLIVLPFILAYFVKFIDTQLRSKQCGKTKIMVLSFILMSLSWWTASTIIAPLNEGLLTCFIYLTLIRLKMR